MLIISRPVFKTCNCKICGTVFQISDNDNVIVHYATLPNGEVHNAQLYAKCPICNFEHVPLEIAGYVGNVTN